MGKQTVYTVAALCLFTLIQCCTGHRTKTAKEWKKLNADHYLRELDAQWFDQDEMKMEDQHQSYTQQHHPDPVILFVKLHSNANAEEIKRLADEWESILLTGGASCTVYKLRDSMLVVKLREGYNVEPVRTFLLAQDHVQMVTSNHIDYFKDGTSKPHTLGTKGAFEL